MCVSHSRLFVRKSENDSMTSSVKGGEASNLPLTSHRAHLQLKVKLQQMACWEIHRLHPDRRQDSDSQRPLMSLQSADQILITDWFLFLSMFRESCCTNRLKKNCYFTSWIHDAKITWQNMLKYEWFLHSSSLQFHTVCMSTAFQRRTDICVWWIEDSVRNTRLWALVMS